MTASNGKQGNMTRRDVLRSGAAGVGAAIVGTSVTQAQESAPQAPAVLRRRPPNILYIICDQLGLDAVAAHGSTTVRTPHIDRLVQRGTTFAQSHSSSPVCSPARSSLMTGFMPEETGVVTNGLPIHQSRRTIGHILGSAGYDSYYCGKWHLPGGVPLAKDGFRVLPSRVGQGQHDDAFISHTCDALIRNRTNRSNPYLLVASFLQPHDICYWGNHVGNRIPLEVPFGLDVDELPELPPNNKVRPKAPAQLDQIQCTWFNDQQWRYYLYLYDRMIEMLDADLGRLVDAVEQSGQADNTIIVFTSDHGDGRGRHSHVSKWYPYEEAMKVPLVFTCPERIEAGRNDTSHLVSGIDIVPTLCDFAGVESPRHAIGRSLRPLLGESTDTPPLREFIVSECHRVGRMVRSERMKFVQYPGDPVEQLFDMADDPWETKNLYEDPNYADALADHRKMLRQYNQLLDPVPPGRSRVEHRPDKEAGAVAVGPFALAERRSQS